jgi:hypothetical protein
VEDLFGARLVLSGCTDKCVYVCGRERWIFLSVIRNGLSGFLKAGDGGGMSMLAAMLYFLE